MFDLRPKKKDVKYVGWLKTPKGLWAVQPDTLSDKSGECFNKLMSKILGVDAQDQSAFLVLEVGETPPREAAQQGYQDRRMLPKNQRQDAKKKFS